MSRRTTSHRRGTVPGRLSDGRWPGETPATRSRPFDIRRDGHLTTRVAGTGTAGTGEVTMANAGHPASYVPAAGVGRVRVPAGRPAGVAVPAAHRAEGA